YRGCIPSKALLHVARLLREASEAGALGIHFEQPRVDLDRLRAWKARVVGKLTGGLGVLCKAKGVRFVRGRGVFMDSRTLRIDGEEPVDSCELKFDHAIVATGSRPATLPFGCESPRVMTSTGALDLADIPESLLVIGGGYIGLELGSVYAALGTRVTVVEMTDALLQGVDGDLARVLVRALEGRFESIRTKTRVERLAEERDSIVVELAGDEARSTERFASVLVAVGRRPNSSGLGLRNTGVEIDESGFIQVDGARRTAEPRIYAIGDVAGQPRLAHKATHEGTTAADAIAGGPAAVAPAAIPAVVFTDPEIAWCGLTEADARTAGVDVAVARFPWQASGRAATLGDAAGLTKLVLDRETERVLGAGIVGPGAGELIAEAVLAVEMGAVAEDLAATIHPHPTLSETVMEAAEVFRGLSVHLHRKR
ncbi:MAG: dihydrolipoyl dehydrogenase, partial [Myxococcales bacterium]